MIKLENHSTDNRAKISWNSNDFLRFLIKTLKIKFLHPMRRSMRMLPFKMRNLKDHEDYSTRQHSEQSPGGVL